jgi:hemerythrin-like domain-containing protein
MSPTEQLKEEHESIRLMLRILEKVCEKLKSKNVVDNEHISQILEFLKIFVDKCHHGKEEDLLFPALEDSGMPRKGSPVGVMFAEHAHGRFYIRNMTENFNKYKKGDSEAAKKFIENARNYIALLTGHIDKENNVLFKMADRALSKKKQEELADAFEKLEIEKIGIGKHEEFHDIIHRLKKIYLDKEKD